MLKIFWYSYHNLNRLRFSPNFKRHSSCMTQCNTARTEPASLVANLKTYSFGMRFCLKFSPNFKRFSFRTTKCNTTRTEPASPVAKYKPTQCLKPRCFVGDYFFIGKDAKKNPRTRRGKFFNQRLHFCRQEDSLRR